MKQHTLLLALCLLISLFSCQSREQSAGFDEDLSFARAPEAQSKEQREAPEAEGAPAAPIERQLIKRGRIVFETADVQETKNLVASQVQAMDGYISSEHSYAQSDRITQQLEIRVPADRFDELLARLAESARRLEEKNVDVQDVTEEFVDVQARLKTKKELESRYGELLAQARTVEDMLAIEREMGNLRTEIESIEGRLRFLKDQVGMSTLMVEYYQKTSAAFGFASRLVQALGEGWEYLLSAIIGLTHLWPFILLGVFAWYGLRWYRRRNRGKK